MKFKIWFNLIGKNGFEGYEGYLEVKNDNVTLVVTAPADSRGRYGHDDLIPGATGMSPRPARLVVINLVNPAGLSEEDKEILHNQVFYGAAARWRASYATIKAIYGEFADRVALMHN